MTRLSDCNGPAERTIVLQTVLVMPMFSWLVFPTHSVDNTHSLPRTRPRTNPYRGCCVCLSQGKTAQECGLVVRRPCFQLEWAHLGECEQVQEKPQRDVRYLVTFSHPYIYLVIHWGPIPMTEREHSGSSTSRPRAYFFHPLSCPSSTRTRMLT